MNAVTALNAALPLAERRCPVCKHGSVSLSEATTVEPYIERGIVTRGRPLPTRRRECIVAACNGCEFIVEVRA